jgi:competence protein ComEC
VSIPGPPRDRHRPDLRLFGAAAGTWAASLAALQVSFRAAVVGAVMAAAAAAVIAARLTLATRRRPLVGRRLTGRLGRDARGWAVAGVLLGVVCGGLATAARTSARDADPLASLARDQAQVRAELTVTDDPRPLRSSRVGPPTYLIPARLTRLLPTGSEAPARSAPAAGIEEKVQLDVRIIVFATGDAWRALLPSQRVTTAGRLAPPRGGDLTAAVLAARSEPEIGHRPSWMQVAAGRLRAGLQAACLPLPAEPSGLLPGLVLGDTSRLDPAVGEEFRETGLTHLVAVSGSNVAIILSVVLYVARWCRAGPWLSAGICAVALAGFVILVRPSPSVVRAAAMGGVGLLALASGRGRSAAPALAAAVVAGLIVDPALAVDPGFALSVLATGALVLLAPRWRDALLAHGVPRGAAEALAVPAAAQVACTPVVAALSGSVSLSAIPANLLAVPAVAPATILGVASAVVSPLWPEAATVLAWLASWPARWLVGIAHVGAGLPAGSVPWPAGLSGGLALAALTVAIIVAARRRVLRRLLVAAALGLAVGAVPVRVLAPGWPPPAAVVVVCDVGQGDAVVLPVGDGEAVVVDAGPDPVPVDACLRRLRVKTVALLVITHFHADHVGGVAGVFRGRTVSELVVPPFDEPAEGERQLRETAGSVPVTPVGPGWRFVRGRLDLRLLGPVRPLAGTRSDANNNSLVLRAERGPITMLLTGDAETEEQRDLLSLGPDLLRADVLKVAHHGSTYQDGEFMEKVDPAVAVVSVGAGNPYGHPSPRLMADLVRGGARVARTDLEGDIAVVAIGDGIGLVRSQGTAGAGHG